MQTDPSLFDLPPRQRVYLPGDPPPPIRVEIPTPITWGAVHAFLAANGQCAQELSKSRRELIHELQARMVFRTSENVYQAPACTIPLFGRSHAVAFFANLPRQVDTKEVVTWDVSDPDLIAPLLTPFTDAHANCIGQSKAMGCTKLNPFVNVVSTLFNMVASSVCRGGRDLMYVNALYILMNDVGEIDYPKTKEKRPIAMSWEDEQRLRTIVQRDLESMAQADFALSSAFLRMLGEEWKWKADAVADIERDRLTAAAVKTAALAAAEAAASAPPPPAREQPQSSADRADEHLEPQHPNVTALVPAAPVATGRAARALRNVLEPRYER